jgi:hypothetical protein
MASETRDPADDLSIIESNEGFLAQGYDGQLAAMEDSMVRCFTCRVDSPAASFRIEALSRTEGASDPADMVANVAVHCPNCGAKGVLTLKYGPEASLAEQEVLSVLDDNRRARSGGTSA